VAVVRRAAAALAVDRAQQLETTRGCAAIIARAESTGLPIREELSVPYDEDRITAAAVTLALRTMLDVDHRVVVTFAPVATAPVSGVAAPRADQGGTPR
jgi:hypothetical protein